MMKKTNNNENEKSKGINSLFGEGFNSLFGEKNNKWIYFINLIELFNKI